MIAINTKLIKLLTLIFIAVVLIFTHTASVSAQTESEFTFDSTAANGQATAQYAATQDVLITGIEINTSFLPSDSAGDACIMVFTPEWTLAWGNLICLHSVRNVAGSTKFFIDLTKTPLFVPKNYVIVLQMNFPTDIPGQQYHMTGFIKYKPYQQGDKRYVTMVIPYIDQLTYNGIVPKIPYYQSSSFFPLKVRAANIFVSYGGAVPPPKNATACLQWLHQNTLVKQQCFDNQTYPVGGSYQTPPLMTLDWDLPIGDAITVDTLGDALDIQVNVIVEVPDDIANSPDLITKDYGNVDRAVLNTWCEQNAQNYGTMNGGVNTLARCKSLYPLACIVTGDCPNSLPGDLNSDGKVDIFDYNLLVGNFGKTGLNIVGDIDNNGKVDIFDYNQLVGNFGK